MSSVNLSRSSDASETIRSTVSSSTSTASTFSITAHVLNVRVRKDELAVLYQAESRDFERLQPVFDAISLSLLQHQWLVE